MIKYGKSSHFLSTQFDATENQNQHQIIEKHLHKYVQCKKRVCCINCQQALEKVLFIRKNIRYFECIGCSHINAEYETDEAFSNYLYNNSHTPTNEYISKYLIQDEQAYIKRMKDIYLPKASFLIESLQADDANVQEFSFFDYGCGSGYFINAILELGYSSVGGQI